MTNTQITALITAIQDNGANTALEVRSVLTAIKNACVLPNEVKWIKMPQIDLPTYFVATGATTGLGIVGQLYEGWAICNGNNTTTNDNGRVSIAYGIDYTTLGAIAGSKDAVVVQHSHGAIIQSFNESSAGNPFGSGGGGAEGTFSYTGQTNPFIISNSGESGVNKNMQPYVVELKIQRIA